MHIATNTSSGKIEISSEKITAEIAKEFSNIFENGDLVFLVGDMGVGKTTFVRYLINCLLYTSPSPRDRTRSRMPSSA